MKLCKRTVKINDRLLYICPSTNFNKRYAFIAIVSVIKKFDESCLCKIEKVLVNKCSQDYPETLGCSYTHLEKLLN